MSSERFAKRLKELRTAAGISQQELAHRVGMALSAIAKLEQDVTVPTWPTVVKLAAALGVSCEAFQQAPATDAEPQGRGRPTPAKKKGKGK